MKRIRVKMWHRKIWIAASVFEEFWNLCNAANSCPLLNFHSTRERCQECRTKKKFWVPIRNQGKNFIIDLFMKDFTHMDSWFFSLSHACDKTKNILVYFFTDLKTNHVSYSISMELVDQWEHTKTTKPLCTSQWIHLT